MNVGERLCGLCDDYSTGPDDIPQIILKFLAQELAEPLSHIFNLSIKNGVFPRSGNHRSLFPCSNGVHELTYHNTVQFRNCRLFQTYLRRSSMIIFTVMRLILLIKISMGFKSTDLLLFDSLCLQWDCLNGKWQSVGYYFYRY